MTILAGLMVLLVLAAVALAGPGDTIRVSTDSAGGEANNDSTYSAISANGRYVAFMSYAFNLVTGDTNSASDVFVKDTLTGTTTRVSTDSVGVQANGGSFNPAISADGRYVAFLSYASNLVPGDTNSAGDAFVKDTLTGTIMRASTDSAGVESDGGADFGIMISADGRIVVFQSFYSTNLHGVFAKDTLTGAVTRLSINWAGIPVDPMAFRITTHAVSADVRYVVFQSYSDYIVPGDDNYKTDVFVRDNLNGAIARVSTNVAGGQANGDSGGGVISANGRYVAFWSSASNLLPAGTYPAGSAGLVLKDTQTGSITGISQSSSTAAAISDDGRYVYFQSDYDEYPGDTNLAKDIYVRDTLTGAISRISTSSNGGQGSMSPWGYLNPLFADSWGASVSADGKYVAFTSGALNLISSKNNWLNAAGRYANDVYVKDTSGCYKPVLALSKTNVYWSSYADYVARQLSIDYRISNRAGYTAFGANITGSGGTNAVTLSTALPYSLGNIAGGGSAARTLMYTVPVGVNSFNVTVNASASDACGAAFIYP